MFHKASLQAVPSEHLPAAHALRRPLPGVAPSLRLEDAGDAKPAWITLLTTEHYNLQMQRVATISESNGRASVFLGAVSAGLIALGFESSTRGAGPVGRWLSGRLSLAQSGLVRSYAIMFAFGVGALAVWFVGKGV